MTRQLTKPEGRAAYFLSPGTKFMVFMCLYPRGLVKFLDAYFASATTLYDAHMDFYRDPAAYKARHFPQSQREDRDDPDDVSTGDEDSDDD